MIKLNNVNKYYNKNKRNENHVLNDITINFPDKGLVMLLGESGSGKTTLLNVLGGLDKSDGGNIEIGGARFKKYAPKAIDAMRAKSIGYIFQNYALFSDKTVKENIRLPLKMIGINDEEEIDKRINTLLKLINMPQYKHRLASQLSGGQQQRIAIVRALAKDPDVIIADEPTGNLDSKNTLAVMRLLKEISKTKLIIMVTHETSLANYYGDEIVHIVDGKVSSRSEARESGAVDTTTDSDIFLGDLNKNAMSSDSDSLSVYKDDHAPSIDGRIIIKDNTVYIDIDQTDLRGINIINEKSDTVIHESTREEVAKHMPESKGIDYPPLEEKHGKKRSVIPFKQILIESLKKVRHSSKLARLMYLAFIGAAAVFTLAFSMMASVFTLDDADFLEDPQYTFNVPRNQFSAVSDLDPLLEEPVFHGLNVRDESRSLAFNLPRFYQTPERESMTSNFALIDQIDEGDIVYGAMPEHPKGVVLSMTYAENLLEQRNLARTGVETMNDLMGLTITTGDDMRPIAGISDHDANVVFVSEARLYNQVREGSFWPRDLVDITINDGRDIESDDEVLAHESDFPGEFSEETRTIGNETYTIVGTHDGPPGTMFTTDALKSFAFNNAQTLRLYASDQAEAVRVLEANNIDYEDSYAIQEAAARSERMQAFSGLLSFSIIALTSSALAYFFIIRSSMLNRIHEIGIYRALGVKRLDVVKLFLVEIVALMSVTSLLGYAGMYYVLYSINQATGELIDVLAIGVVPFFLGLLLLYVFHVVFGLLPLVSVLRKTPAEIQATYDI